MSGTPPVDAASSTTAGVSRRQAPATTVDEELMMRYAAGDAGAFEALYGRHKGALYRFLLRQCGSKSIAEELYQDVWLRVISTRSRYEPRARFKTFLFHLAHNRLIDHYRSTLREVPLSYNMDDGAAALQVAAAALERPDAQAERAEMARRLLDQLDKLPEAQREAFLLKEEAGFSVAEIAAATGVDPETAKSRLRYAVTKLRAGLASAG